MERFFMEVESGAVDTIDGWKADFDACPVDEREMAGWPEKFEDADLVEVLPDPEGGHIGLGDSSHWQ